VNGFLTRDSTANSESVIPRYVTSDMGGCHA
jgi:hypothetical protein